MDTLGVSHFQKYQYSLNAFFTHKKMTIFTVLYLLTLCALPGTGKHITCAILVIGRRN